MARHMAGTGWEVFHLNSLLAFFRPVQVVLSIAFHAY